MTEEKMSVVPSSVDPKGNPWDRLKDFGASTLTNEEILAVILGSGPQDKNALSLARELLKALPSLTRLGHVTLKELEAIPGIDPIKALEIQASFELGKRMSMYRRINQGRITTSKDVAYYIMEKYRTCETESFICLEMSQKHEILSEHKISQGGLDGTSAHPRDLFCTLLRNRVAAFIIVHNHPSGDPEPSPADIRISHRLRDGAELLGLRFLDHIIVGDGNYVSLKERGIL
ncbi:MAG: DNA repair protein RadC [Candidatus Hydrogenedens sp.]|nr:DNA repair protein RadC [Candidatus Hydrogenedens sp.]